jgi:hypothetical protein
MFKKLTHIFVIEKQEKYFSKFQILNYYIPFTMIYNNKKKKNENILTYIQDYFSIHMSKQITSKISIDIFN